MTALTVDDRAVGGYHDDVVRTADGWRLRRRRSDPRTGGVAGALLDGSGRAS